MRARCGGVGLRCDGWVEMTEATEGEVHEVGRKTCGLGEKKRSEGMGR